MKYRAVLPVPSPMTIPGRTKSSARTAAARFCSSTCAAPASIYLIGTMSGRIRRMDRLMASLPGRVVAKFMEDQAPNWAALIAWNALFAMFPIVLFVAAVLGFALRIFGQANAQVYSIIFSAIPTGSKDQSEMLKAVSGVKSASGVLFIVGLVGLLWGGSALFGTMEQAFAVIYHTKPRDFIRQKLISFGMVVLFTLLVGVEVNSVIYPVEVEQPARGQTVTAAPKTAKEADRRGTPTMVPSSNGSAGPVRSGIKARTALLMAVGASVVGLLLGRRSASAD